MIRRLLRKTLVWLSPIFDPMYALRGLAAYPGFLFDWRQYRRMPSAEKIHWADAYPQLHDRTDITQIDAHYFYVNSWAIRRIIAQCPEQHVDIGSQVVFAGLLSATVPVTFVDYRPLQVELDGLVCLRGSIHQLPFADGSIESLSCLHVAEHIGLGRYGDPLDPLGTRKAVKEIIRVLKPGGHLYFALPVGMPKVCFNAHRIHAVETIRSYFQGLDLKEFSGVHDDGRYVEHAALEDFDTSEYACGMFWFVKPQ